MTTIEERTYISIRVAVQRTGLPEQIVEECITRRMVAEPMTEADLAELRRIRRLQELGINLPGIEAILHMRRRMQDLQATISRLEGPDWERPDWMEVQARRQRFLPPREGDR
jgi:hypothetical protein